MAWRIRRMVFQRPSARAGSRNHERQPDGCYGRSRRGVCNFTEGLCLNLIFPPFRTGIIVLMPLAGRCSFVVMMTALPYVRREGGLATAFGVGKSWLNVLWTSAFLLAAGWLAGRWLGLAAGFSALLLAALFSVYCFRKIGGYTGDTLGAGSSLRRLSRPSQLWL